MLTRDSVALCTPSWTVNAVLSYVLVSQQCLRRHNTLMWYFLGDSFSVHFALVLSRLLLAICLRHVLYPRLDLRAF